MGDQDKTPAWVAEVFPDWTTLQVLSTGEAFAFQRETGKVYPIPHPDCPFAAIKGPYSAQFNAITWAEALIRQLPDTHEGRNSWLRSFGRWE